MISAVLRDYISDQLGLVVGTDVFAESAVGEQYVLVKVTYDRPWTDMDSLFRTAHVQVVVDGYSIGEGHRMSERIVSILEPLTGVYTYDGDEYTIKSITPVGLPILATYKDFRAFSINFSVGYIYKFTE